jgi:hypothetical protein
MSSEKEQKMLKTCQSKLIFINRAKVRIFGADFECRLALFRQNKYFPFAFGSGKQTGILASSVFEY